MIHVFTVRPDLERSLSFCSINEVTLSDWLKRLSVQAGLKTKSQVKRPDSNEKGTQKITQDETGRTRLDCGNNVTNVHRK